MDHPDVEQIMHYGFVKQDRHYMQEDSFVEVDDNQPDEEE